MHARSKTQASVALSSGEAEYYGVVSAAAASLYTQNLLSEWGWPLKIKLWCDASAARAIAQRLGVGKVKHIQTRYLWLQEKVDTKQLEIASIPSADNHSDVLTKHVPAAVLERHLVTLGLVDYSHAGVTGVKVEQQ